MKKTFLIGLALLLSQNAFAKPPENGTLQGVIFSGTSKRPVVGVQTALVAGTQTVATTTSDEHGSFTFQIPAGAYRVRIAVNNQTFPLSDHVPVVANEFTELLVTFNQPDQPPTVDIEAASQQGPVAVATVEVKEQQQGTVAGRVVHAETGKAVAGARVVVRQVARETRTDRDGRFSLTLPAPAQYDLTIVHPKFSTLAHSATHVVPDKTTEIQFDLTPTGLLLDDYTVTAPRVVGSTLDLLLERRESGNVTDVIGAEQMAKAGDSDAAGALKRVTGITVVGGKYVYVRGLGERYSSTLFNGATLPSPEPGRRVVPLDLFPTNILESVVIQKSYSPDLPADFGGGVVKLRTRGFPGTWVANVALSTGARVGTTFAEGLGYEGGPTDFFGIDSGFRSLPDIVAQASAQDQIKPQNRFSDEGFTPEELAEFGRALPNIWDAKQQSVLPNFGLSASLGNSTAIWGGRGGFLAGLIYDNEWLAQPDKEVNIFTSSTSFNTEGDPEPGHRYTEQRLTNAITLAGILNAGWQRGANDKFQSTTVVARVSEDETRQYEGFNRDLGSDLRVTRLTWVERMLFSQQFKGEHRWGNESPWELDWRYTFSLAERIEPDRREYRYDLKPQTGLWLLSDRPEGNQRFFGELFDTNHDLGVDGTMPFAQWFGLPSQLRAGLMGARKDRSVDVRRFTLRPTGEQSRDSDLIRQGPEQIFAPENIGGDGFQFTEVTLDTDNYTGDHTLGAGYLMVDLPLGWNLRLVGGLRVEYSRQFIQTFKPFSPEVETIDTALTTTDFLPTATLSWEMHEGMLLRLGFAQTVNRPTLRELSPAVMVETTGGRLFFGNPDLQRALIRHFDLRWEWFFNKGEYLALSGFFKDFTNPIELLVIRSAQFSITPGNSQGAQNYGIELELRKHFGFLHPVLRDLSIAGNAALIRSQVTLPEGGTITLTSTERPLQGQSPFVVNFQLGYDNVDWGSRITLLYNVFGRRIAEVGAQGAPDIYEEPVHQFDLVVRQKLGAGFSASFKAQNLFNATSRRTQGGYITERYRNGRVFSLGLTKNF